MKQRSALSNDTTLQIFNKKQPSHAARENNKDFLL